MEKQCKRHSNKVRGSMFWGWQPLSLLQYVIYNVLEKAERLESELKEQDDRIQQHWTASASQEIWRKDAYWAVATGLLLLDVWHCNGSFLVRLLWSSFSSTSQWALLFWVASFSHVLFRYCSISCLGGPVLTLFPMRVRVHHATCVWTQVSLFF